MLYIFIPTCFSLKGPRLNPGGKLGEIFDSIGWGLMGEGRYNKKYVCGRGKGKDRKWERERERGNV